MAKNILHSYEVVLQAFPLKCIAKLQCKHCFFWGGFTQRRTSFLRDNRNLLYTNFSFWTLICCLCLSLNIVKATTVAVIRIVPTHNRVWSANLSSSVFTVRWDFTRMTKLVAKTPFSGNACTLGVFDCSFRNIVYCLLTRAFSIVPMLQNCETLCLTSVDFHNSRIRPPAVYTFLFLFTTVCSNEFTLFVSTCAMRADSVIVCCVGLLGLLNEGHKSPCWGQWAERKEPIGAVAYAHEPGTM